MYVLCGVDTTCALVAPLHATLAKDAGCSALAIMAGYAASDRPQPSPPA
nr:hypothetical protein [Rhodococcus fascians]